MPTLILAAPVIPRKGCFPCRLLCTVKLYQTPLQQGKKYQISFFCYILSNFYSYFFYNILCTQSVPPNPLTAPKLTKITMERHVLWNWTLNSSSVSGLSFEQRWLLLLLKFDESVYLLSVFILNENIQYYYASFTQFHDKNSMKSPIQNFLAKLQLTLCCFTLLYYSIRQRIMHQVEKLTTNPEFVWQL